MNRHASLIIATILLSLPLTSVFAADPQVDVTSIGRRKDESGILSIYYNLVSDGACTVSVKVSSDNGSTWDVPARFLSGDVGAGVSPGGGKKITWDSCKDIPGAFGSNYRIRVTAVDQQSGPQGMVFVTIPGGTFQMGDSSNSGYSDEKPVHTVNISAFKLSKYEVTNGQFCEYLNAALAAGQITLYNSVVYAKSDTSHSQPYFETTAASSYSHIGYLTGSKSFDVLAKNGRNMANDPVVKVSWYGAEAFCDYYGYRLPTEAEWECAARGGLSGKRFPWGDTITHSRANYYSRSSYSYDVSSTRGYHPDYDDTRPYTAPVGSFPDNGYGLYDMAGNVWEWCSDWYDSDYYDYSPTNNPPGPPSGSYRVVRGGGWRYLANDCRSAGRSGDAPGYRSHCIGFRPALNFH